MASHLRIRSLLCGAFALAALALSGPGLQVARADGEAGFTSDPRLVELAARPAPAPSADAGERCEAGQTPGRRVQALEQRMAAMRAQAERQLARGDAPPQGGAVPLNNRGYNY